MIWLEPHLISQSLQAFSSAVGRFERLWDNGISLNMFSIFFPFLFQNNIQRNSLQATNRRQRAGETLGSRLGCGMQYQNTMVGILRDPGTGKRLSRGQCLPDLLRRPPRLTAPGSPRMHDRLKHHCGMPRCGMWDMGY